MQKNIIPGFVNTFQYFEKGYKRPLNAFIITVETLQTLAHLFHVELRSSQVLAKLDKFDR